MNNKALLYSLVLLSTNIAIASPNAAKNTAPVMETKDSIFTDDELDEIGTIADLLVADPYATCGWVYLYEGYSKKYALEKFETLFKQAKKLADLKSDKAPTSVAEKAALNALAALIEVFRNNPQFTLNDWQTLFDVAKQHTTLVKHR